jgi:uncharacterized protein YjdB
MEKKMIKKLYKKFVIAIVAVVLTLTSFGCNQLPPDNSVPVTGVTLNKTELTLNVGEAETLIATVNPTNATINDRAPFKNLFIVKPPCF